MTYHTRVTEAGELILSAEIARALGLLPGDDIAVEREASSASVKLVPASVSVVRDNVDHFVAERFNDWGE